MLQCSYLTKQGIQLDNALVVIDKVQGTLEETSFHFFIFRDVQAFNDKLEPLEDLNYSFITDLNSQFNALVQCYNFLKTLDKFKDSTDI